MDNERNQPRGCFMLCIPQFVFPSRNQATNTIDLNPYNTLPSSAPLKALVSNKPLHVALLAKTPNLFFCSAIMDNNQLQLSLLRGMYFKHDDPSAQWQTAVFHGTFLPQIQITAPHQRNTFLWSTFL